MSGFKRPFEEVSGYSSFPSARNVHARICLRQKLAHTPTLRPQFTPILKTKSYAYRRPFPDPKCKENIPRDANHISRDMQTLKALSTVRNMRIRFHQKVAVHSIPPRNHYSKEIKQLLWNDKRTLRVMARRNTIEFASEGYDWRRATEDDAMILSPTGERIHPVWANFTFSSHPKAIPSISHRSTSMSNAVPTDVRALPVA